MKVANDRKKRGPRKAVKPPVKLATTEVERRILILAPTGNDAALTTDFLTKANLTAHICRDMPQLGMEVGQGCGTILLAEETLGLSSVSVLIQALAAQPSWSDVPIILITSGGEVSQTRLRRLAIFGPGGNVTLLERPFRPATLISTVQVALRARQRQYEVRKLVRSTEELVREREAKAQLFDTTLSSIADLAYTFDLEGNWIYANQPLLKLWGKTLAEITGRSSLELGYPPELAHRLKQQVKEVIATRRPLKGETYFTDAAGVEDYHEYIFSPVLAADGTVTAVCGTTRLTTERKRIEGILQRNGALFSALVDQAPNGVYVVDAQFRLQQINARALPAFENVHPQIGRDFSEVMEILWGPEVGGEIVKIFRHTLATGERYISPRFSELRQDLGEKKSYEWETQRVTLPDGQHGVVCYFNDITEPSRMARAAQQLAAIIESSEDAIISKDLNGVITSWNQGAERLFGYTAAEAVGHPVTMLMPPERWNEEPNILQRIRRGERIEHYESVRQHKDGSRLDISLTVSPIQDADGKVVGASKIVRNISGQKRAKRDLEQAHRELLAAARAKDDFLAALSHELRTPLNPALLIASESADNHQLPEAVRLNFEAIRKSIELEARLIDDLLDLTRITSGKLSLSKMPVEIHAVLQDALATVQAEQQEKRIQLSLQLAAEKFWVEGDAVRLQQVFWNVLKNAVKFTPPEGSLKVETRRSDDGWLAIKISDSGLGMNSDELARVFSAFAQGDHAGSGGSHRFGGLGLGLAISKNLVELHAGKIRAESAGRDCGASFIIELPLIQKESGNLPVMQESPANTPPQTRSGIRILLVEDHEPTRTALAHLLVRRRCEVKSAASVAEARALAAQHPFDLLISDIGLPDGNGFDLMSELRANNNALRGIALTGYGMEEDIARSRKAGFVSHLVKPIRVQALEAALALAFVRD